MADVTRIWCKREPDVVIRLISSRLIPDHLEHPATTQPEPARVTRPEYQSQLSSSIQPEPWKICMKSQGPRVSDKGFA